jgi:hypothetical protein
VDQNLESLLAWHEEVKAELKSATNRKGALEKQILEIAKERGMRGAVRFDYAGMYFEASLNFDRTRTKNPNKDEVIEQFRKMLPEGEQTVENARKVYDSLTKQASMQDSVTSKAVDPPKEVFEQKELELKEELNKGQ